MTRADLARQRPWIWLNDNNIDFVLRLAREESSRASSSSLHLPKEMDEEEWSEQTWIVSALGFG